MVRFGRGFPIPRQNFLTNPVSEVKEVVVILAPISDPSAGIHFLSLKPGDVSILTSEEIVIDILGQGTGLATGDLGTGAVDGAGSTSADITGFHIGQLTIGEVTLTGDVGDYGGWRNPAGRYPRRKWKKNKPFKDYYHETGVEFLNAVVAEDDYGAWFYLVDEDNAPVPIRSEQDISSDYSIEGRP